MVNQSEKIMIFFAILALFVIVYIILMATWFKQDPYRKLKDESSVWKGDWKITSFENRHYLGPFNWNGEKTKTFNFSLDVTKLGSAYNANVYIVVPYEKDYNPDTMYADAQAGHPKEGPKACPEYDLIETCGSVGGAFAFHCDMGALGQSEGVPDGNGCDRGMQLRDLDSSEGTWDTSNKAYVDGTSIKANKKPVELTCTIDFENYTVTVKYGGVVIFDASKTPEDFNNMWGGDTKKYVNGMVNDLKARTYYIYSTVWQTYPGAWYACQHDGLTSLNLVEGGSAIITHKGC